jgi:TonB family protein
MASDHFQGALNLLGQADPASPSLDLPGHPEGPQLEVPWGDFHQGFGSGLRALFLRAPSWQQLTDTTFFRDCWIESRIPRRAVLAAALWHVVFVAMPFPNVFLAPRRNPALQNVELTWSGPINDLPLINIPRQKAKLTPRGESNKPLPQPGADAFHPRQRIFTDPVHPTHPRQTLINPKAPFEPPKLLPNLPNVVQFQQAAVPARPRLLINEETLKKLRPRERRIKAVVSAPLPDVQNAEQRSADISLLTTMALPERPKLQINAGAAPRVAPRAQNGDAAPAPDVGSTQLTAANGSANALIALSATPGPPAPVQPPPGNAAARISMSPEGKPGATGSVGPTPNNGGAGTASGEGKSPIGISISGGNPAAANNASGLGGAAKIGASSPRRLILRPDPRIPVDDDAPERTGPPNFAMLPPGAKPEQIFAARRVYTMNVNMPNLNSSTGSWILNFSELRSNSSGPHITSSDLTGPAPMRKIDPKYPQTLIGDRVEGEVVLYAIIRGDGSVDGIQLVHGIDEQLDANAMEALSQWKFRPAARQDTPVELEAIVHIPFHVPVAQ